MIKCANQTMHKISLIVIVFRWTFASALIAYDCRTPGTNITAVSLRDVAECPDLNAGYKSSQMTVQVLQRRLFGQSQVQTCLMEVTRLIHYCGMHSHISTVHQSLLTYVYTVGADECKHMHRYKNFQGFPGQTINKLTINGTMTASLTLAGLSDLDGRCEGSVYIENGITWKNVVVMATVKITLMEYTATVKLETNLISLQHGVTCVFTDAYCVDTVAGESTWNLQPFEKCDQYDPVYAGPAYLVRTTQRDFTTPEAQYMVIEQKDRVFALSLRRKDNVCGATVWTTEHPRLIISDSFIVTRRRKNDAAEHQAEIDMTSYVNSKFLYVEQSYKRAIDKMYINAVHRRCLLRREILRNRLITAPFAPNIVSALIKNQLGYVGHVAGEVLYILQCIPRIVQLRRVTECFHELPVTVSYESMFMSPTTNILQRNAEQVDCNGLIPPVYRIDGQWIAFTPAPTFGHAPIELPVDTEPLLHFKPIQNLGTGGLYTDEEISAAQNAIMFGLERAAVSNILTRKMAGLSVHAQGTSALNLFDTHELESIAQSTLTHIWSWFEHLGLFTSGFLGIYFIIKFVKSVIEVILNGFAIHKTLGCGLSLFASLWDNLTMWLVHRNQRRDDKTPTSQVAKHTDTSEYVEMEIRSAPSSSSGGEAVMKPRNSKEQPCQSMPCTSVDSGRWS